MGISENLSTRDRLILFIRVSVWFGLVMGVIEYAYTLIYKSLGGHVHMSKDYFWMTPVADIAICIGIGLILFLLSMIFPHLATTRLLVFTFIFTILLSLHFVEVKISQIAAFLLAFGIAFQISSMLAKRMSEFIRFVRQSLPWMLLALGVVFIARLAYQL